jgi:hypothetical protein
VIARVGWFILGCLLLAGGAVSHAHSGGPESCGVEEFKSVGAGLVALGGRGLLVWSPRGATQARREDGSWTAPGRASISDVREAIPDAEGALLVRVADPAEVVLLDTTGAQKETWHPHLGLAGRPSPPFSVFGRGTRRWLVTTTGLTPLLAQSKLGPPATLPPSITDLLKAKSASPATLPDVLALDEGSVLACLRRPACPDKRDCEDGVCERTGSHVWRTPDRYAGRSVLCGSWIVHGDKDLVAARAVETGAISTERRLKGGVDRPLACAGPDRVVVGDDKTVTLLSLPDLRTLAERRLRSGRIAAVAITGDRIATTTKNQSTVHLFSSAPTRCISDDDADDAELAAPF